MEEKGKLATPWLHTYENLTQGLYFHGHSSVFVNENKPNVMIFAEPSPELVLKRASWGSGRIILIDTSDMERKLTDGSESEDALGYSRVILLDTEAQLNHNRLAQLGHTDITENARTVWKLSHKKLRELESNQRAVHIPLLESKSSFFKSADLDLSSLQAWHFLEVVKAFVGGEDMNKDVLAQYHPILTALNTYHKTQGGDGKLLLPCIVGGGLGKPSYYTSVNTSFLNQITGAYHIKNCSFIPENKSHSAHLKGMPKDFYLWLNTTIIGNEDEPVMIAELIDVWENLMR